MPAVQTLVDAVHSGLTDAWLFAFRATDTPGTPPKPEYVGTVTVAEKVLAALNGTVGTVVRLEENVQKLAADCLVLPPFPPLRPRPRISSRKIGSKGDRERVDIAIHDTKAGLLPVARALVELKISDGAGGLLADLTRNQQFMQLVRPGRQNQLDAAMLGFVVVDGKSRGVLAGRQVLSNLAKRFDRMAQRFLSTDYVTEVSIRQMSSPPEDEDDEFVHMASVVITFVRPSKTSVPMPSRGTRFWSKSSTPDVVVVDMPV